MLIWSIPSFLHLLPAGDVSCTRPHAWCMEPRFHGRLPLSCTVVCAMVVGSWMDSMHRCRRCVVNHRTVSTAHFPSHSCGPPRLVTCLPRSPHLGHPPLLHPLPVCHVAVGGGASSRLGSGRVDTMADEDGESFRDAGRRSERGVEVTFVDMHVQMSEDDAQPQLDVPAGACRVGRLTAIMGPSGAGKTMLMSSLRGHFEATRGAEIRGRVFVDGERRDEASFGRLCAFVAQQDALPPNSTVEEAVLLSAQLRLQGTIAEKQKVVDNAIQELGLERVRKNLIGGVRRRGLSGGEMRRVSVAIEMVTDPALLLLDEPTSGLDSSTAMSTMQAVHQLAQRGRTVVATIHQPNSDLVALFDDLLLLAKGKLIYYGPYEEAVHYFKQQGFPCPLYTLPTDYFLKVISDPANVQGLADAYCTTTVPKLLQEFPYLDKVESREESSSVQDPQVKASWMKQVWLLTARFAKNWQRDPILLYAELVQYLVLAVFVGLMYLRLSDSLTEGSVQDRGASLWFMLVVVCFTPPFSVLTVFESERFLLHKEHTGGWYTISAYFAARTLITIPIEAVLSFAFSVISYFMVGLQSSGSKFFTFYAAVAIFQLISETLGLFSAVLVPTAAYGVLVVSLILLLFLSFSGFLISSTPVYFVWLQKASYFNYAYSIVVQNEFDGLRLCCNDEGEPVSADDDKFLFLGNNPLSIPVNFWVLLGMLIGWRMVCYLVFKLKEMKIVSKAFTQLRILCCKS